MNAVCALTMRKRVPAKRSLLPQKHILASRGERSQEARVLGKHRGLTNLWCECCHYTILSPYTRLTLRSETDIPVLEENTMPSLRKQLTEEDCKH